MGQCPLNHMPDDLETPGDPNNTTTTTEGLSKTRQTSTIPRADSPTTWQYPSEAMFSSALHRKHHPVPATAIPAMLAIHNSLNEQVWREIMATWESRYDKECGEERRLKRFQGRPERWSPLAWWYYVRHGVQPYDRHDWVVERCGKEVRYVIDYYESAGDFSCVIRPALDSTSVIWDRLCNYFRGE